MKLWTWLKSLSWVAAIGTVLVAVAFAMAGLKAGRNKRNQLNAEKQVESLAHDQTRAGIEAAAKHQKKADKAKKKVAAAHKTMESNLEEMGKANEDIDSIADRFNSKRVRRSSG